MDPEKAHLHAAEAIRNILEAMDTLKAWAERGDDPEGISNAKAYERLVIAEGLLGEAIAALSDTDEGRAKA